MPNDLQDQMTMKLKSSLDDCSGRVRITFAADFLIKGTFKVKIFRLMPLNVYIYIYNVQLCFSTLVLTLSKFLSLLSIFEFLGFVSISR